MRMCSQQVQYMYMGGKCVYMYIELRTIPLIVKGEVLDVVGCCKMQKTQEERKTSEDQ